MSNSQRMVPFVVGTLWLSAPAHAGSLNAWGTALGERTTAFMPFVLSSPGEQLGQVYVASGMGARADLNVGVGTTLDGGGRDTLFELMPRFFPVDAVGIGIHAYVPADPGEVVVGPEVHAEWGRGPLVLAGNIGWTPVFSSASTQPGSIWLVMAPEIILTERASVFLEVDPVVDLAAMSSTVTLVPGVGYTVDAQGNHSASLGVGITPGEQPELSVGLAWTSMWSADRRTAPSYTGRAEVDPQGIEVASADK